jgi:hypothetical protein
MNDVFVFGTLKKGFPLHDRARTHATTRLRYASAGARELALEMLTPISPLSPRLAGSPLRASGLRKPVAAGCRPAMWIDVGRGYHPFRGADKEKGWIAAADPMRRPMTASSDGQGGLRR